MEVTLFFLANYPEKYVLEKKKTCRIFQDKKEPWKEVIVKNDRTAIAQ